MRKVGPALQSSLSQQWTSHSIVLKAAWQVVLASVTHFSLTRHLLANVSTSPTLVYTLPHRSKAGAHVWLDVAQAFHEIVVEQVKQVKPNTGWIRKLRDYFDNERTPTSHCKKSLKQPPPFSHAMWDSVMCLNPPLPPGRYSPYKVLYGEDPPRGPTPTFDCCRSLGSSRGWAQAHFPKQRLIIEPGALPEFCIPLWQKTSLFHTPFFAQKVPFPRTNRENTASLF